MRTSSGCRSATLSERATTMTIRRLSLAAALGLALVAVGCHNDDLFTPLMPAYKGGAMFVRYVAMGNSITAGFQSGTITRSTQLGSDVRRVADAMGAPYYYPQLVYPGCPPPFTNIFTNTRLLGGTATTCYYRATPIPPFLTNVAVPSAEVIDILHNGPFVPGTNSNPLTQLMLGGRTQIQAMAAAHPTFVSVWIGNNDVLGSVLSATNAGDPALVTPVTTFQTEYQEIVDSINSVSAKAILIGVANVTEIPFVSQGQTYVALQAAGQLPPHPFLNLGPDCAPRSAGGIGDSVLVPFPFGAAKVDSASQGASVTI